MADLFLKDPEGVDLYLYFENLLYPERSGKVLSVPVAEKYYISLPFDIVSPFVYREDSLFPKALGMSSEALRDICYGLSVLVPKDLVPDDITAAHFPYRDAMIIRSVSYEGLYGVEAFQYLRELYLYNLSCEGTVINAVYVDADTAKSLAMSREEFTKDPRRAAYFKAFYRMTRMITMYRVHAPNLLLRNELKMFLKALDELATQMAV